MVKLSWCDGSSIYNHLALLAKFALGIFIKNPIVSISMHLHKLPIMFKMYSHVNFNALPKKKSNKAWVVGCIDEK
jgi:hypothetical protein